MLFPTVNECRLGIDNCHENARCLDTYESFRCICKNGYAGSGVQCSGENYVSITTKNATKLYRPETSRINELHLLYIRQCPCTQLPPNLRAVACETSH